VGNLLELQLFLLPGLSWFISATVLSQVQHIKKIDEFENLLDAVCRRAEPQPLSL
jgi:hypothetical protein